MRKNLLPMQMSVRFNIAQGMDRGTAIIIDNDVKGEDVYYKLQVVTGSLSDLHRDEKGDLWVNDNEVRACSQP